MTTDNNTWDAESTEELSARLDSLSHKLKTGESTVEDTIDGVDHLLDDLPARPDTGDKRGGAIRRVFILIHQFEGKVNAVKVERGLAANDAEGTLECAACMYCAIEEARDLLVGSRELQDALMNPDEYGVNAREVVVSAFEDTCNDVLEVIAKSDSNVLNDYVAGEWLEEIDGQIIGGVDWLSSPYLTLRDRGGRLVIDSKAKLDV